MRRFVLSLLVTGVWAQNAAAATVSVDPCAGGKYCVAAVAVRADPGEVNRLGVTTGPSGTEVADAGAALRAGDGCTATATGTVRCERVAVILVSAGDGDDRVQVGGDGLLLVALDGGPGDDELIGAASDDRVDGGGGADRLDGGGGDDELFDGDATGSAGADAIDGGPGVDVVDYSLRRAPVKVRLGRRGTDAHAGEQGEDDRLAGVEGAFGGDGDDVLRAGRRGASPSTSDEVDGDTPGLYGGSGDDVLIGGPGDDRIDASEGADRVRGGAGDDDIELPFSLHRRGARVRCGAGFDLIGSAAPADRISRSCDLIYVGDYETGLAPARPSAGGIRVTQLERPVTVSVTTDGGRLIAHRTFRTRPGRLHLTALGRRLAHRRRLPAVRVTCRAGRETPSGFRLTS